MLPKSLAVIKPKTVAQFVSFPLTLAVRLVDPIMPVLKTINLISRRLILPNFEIGNEGRDFEISKSGGGLM